MFCIFVNLCHTITAFLTTSTSSDYTLMFFLCFIYWDKSKFCYESLCLALYRPLGKILQLINCTKLEGTVYIFKVVIICIVLTSLVDEFFNIWKCVTSAYQNLQRRGKTTTYWIFNNSQDINLDYIQKTPSLTFHCFGISLFG